MAAAVGFADRIMKQSQGWLASRYFAVAPFAGPSAAPVPGPDPCALIDVLDDGGVDRNGGPTVPSSSS